MIFSSISFLYYFLPILIVIYFMMKPKFHNKILLIASLLFYYLSEPKYFYLLIISCLIYYLVAKKLKHNKPLFILICICNIGLLCFFKYSDLLLSTFDLPLLNIALPIGISFYSFQALAYLIDVYLGKHEACDSLTDFIMYISFFPQLIAGPIVRYRDVMDEIKTRHTSSDDMAIGIWRFVIGLAKKVLLANIFGELVIACSGYDLLGTYLRAIAIMLQLYFDFSGYSDMAIGLGRMFGFHFLENFNYPLIANSISDFWRRWHISLSSWFKDYVYIPLGGSRVNLIKQLRNILIIWLLTGIWHGASYNYLLWGLYFALLLILEKYVFKGSNRLISLFLILISFVIFHYEDLNTLLLQLKAMIPFINKQLISQQSLICLRNYGLYLIVGIIAATPLVNNIAKKMNQKLKDILQVIICISLLILCSAFLVDASFNPFLYFRF